MAETMLTVRGMTKTFGPTVALNNVDFTLKRGEIHGLIGENGSGKSTLTSIIDGMRPADCGEMELFGEPYNPKTSVEAQERGITMIVQEMGTAPSISVAENIFLGNEGEFTHGGFVHRGDMRKAAQEALDAVGAGYIKAGMPAGALEPEDRKVMEIAKAMRGNPEIMIVDETTTALTQDGRELLYNCINKMQSEDKGIILISHDLDEILSVCTIVTVLRDGNIIGTLTKDEFDANKIKSMMVGREVADNLYRNDFDGSFGDEVVMTADHLTGHWKITDMSFELHKGEILGFGGLSDGGIHELGRLLFGLDDILQGEVRLEDGQKISDPIRSVKQGIGYVSKNRDEEAIMLNASVKNNSVLPALWILARAGIFIPPGAETNLAKKVVGDMEIKCASMDQPVGSLSGGNKQKVSFGKWLGCGSKILILDCPTRGIDIGVKASMYQLIYELKEQGFSIILISEELQELIGMSDRIMILKEGRIGGEYSRSESLSEGDLVQVMV